jgi:integrase
MEDRVPMSSRRGHGEGTITQRRDGRWEARISLGGGKRKTLYGKTRKEARDRLLAAQRDRENGSPVPDQRLKLGQYLDGWLEDAAKPAIRPLTYASYRSMVRLHIKPALGSRPLAKLGPSEVQEFLNHKHASGLSARTVQHLHAVLRRALGQALRWGLVPRNVAALATSPRVVRKEVSVWTPEQARAFLDGIDGHRLEGLYALALAIGVRQGEALGLKWEDLDLDGGTLTVRRQLQRIDSKLQLVEWTKTGRSRRTIAIPGFAVAALRQHRARQIEDRPLAGGKWRGEDWGLVFMTRTAPRSTPRTSAVVSRPCSGSSGSPRCASMTSGTPVPR